MLIFHSIVSMTQSMQITVVICVKAVRDFHIRHHHLKNFQWLQINISLRLTTRSRTTVLPRVHEKQDTQPVLFFLPTYHDINHIMSKNRTHHLSCFSNQIMIHQNQDTQPVMSFLPKYHDIDLIMTKNRTHHLSCFSSQIMIHQNQDTQPVMSFLPKYNDIDLIMFKNRTHPLSCFSSQTMMAPSSASASSSSSL